MFRDTINFKGEKCTMSVKRSLDDWPQDDAHCSHRPEYGYVTIEKNHTMDNSGSQREEIGGKMLEALVGMETVVHPTQWALRRVPIASRMKCNH